MVRGMIRDFADGAAWGCGVGLMVLWLDLWRIGSMLDGRGAGLTALFLWQGGLIFGIGNVGLGVAQATGGRADGE
jgi:hypothetical protein